MGRIVQSAFVLLEGKTLAVECVALAGCILGIKISERKVDDEQMSTCPACNKDLGRVIPPGVVHRAVGDKLFERPFRVLGLLSDSDSMMIVLKIH